MTIYFYRRKYFLARIPLALLFSVAAFSASAQVIPQFKVPPRIAVFGSFTDVKPDYVSFSDFAVYGFSVGGYFQTRHIVGAEIRGSITRWGGDQHEESALAGATGANALRSFFSLCSRSWWRRQHLVVEQSG